MPSLFLFVFLLVSLFVSISGFLFRPRTFRGRAMPNPELPGNIPRNVFPVRLSTIIWRLLKPGARSISILVHVFSPRASGGFILNSRRQTNKAHNGWQPKWRGYKLERNQIGLEGGEGHTSHDCVRHAALDVARSARLGRNRGTFSHYRIRYGTPECKHLSNRYGISKQDEHVIRARDKRCVYCGILMKERSRASAGTTIEHFNNDGPFDEIYNLAICCRRCNSSKGTMKLSGWFKTPYCREREINEQTVSQPVRNYMRLVRRRACNRQNGTR